MEQPSFRQESTLTVIFSGWSITKSYRFQSLQADGNGPVFLEARSKQNLIMTIETIEIQTANIIMILELRITDNLKFMSLWIQNKDSERIMRQLVLKMLETVWHYFCLRKSL